MKNFLKNYSGVLATLIVFSLFLMPIVVNAQASGPNAGFGDSPNAGGNTGPNAGGNTGPNAGFQGGGTTNTSGQYQTLINPLGGVTSFCQLIILLLNAVMVIGIPIAILFIVWAGFKFVLAQGNPGALETAKKNFLNVIIGLAIFIGASLIASVMVHTLEQLGVQGLNSCATSLS